MQISNKSFLEMYKMKYSNYTICHYIIIIINQAKSTYIALIILKQEIHFYYLL